MPADIEHEVVAPFQPHDNSIKVWRYMDVTRLVALMETRSLHFARADTLGDEFEGSLALGNWNALDEQFTEILKSQKKLPPSRRKYYTRRQLRADVMQFFRKERTEVFINCWHSGGSESLAMWKQYGSTDGSVVIQSTYQTLLDALPSEVPIDDASGKRTNIYMGMVQYKNYFDPSEGLEWNSNMFGPFIHKRTAYEYEKEVRAFLMSPTASSRVSIAVNVDIQQLIETIRVRPGTPDWQRQTIEALVRKYGLGNKVAHSEIDLEPLP